MVDWFNLDCLRTKDLPLILRGWGHQMMRTSWRSTMSISSSRTSWKVRSQQLLDFRTHQQLMKSVLYNSCSSWAMNLYFHLLYDCQYYERCEGNLQPISYAHFEPSWLSVSLVKMSIQNRSGGSTPSVHRKFAASQLLLGEVVSRGERSLLAQSQLID